VEYLLFIKIPTAIPREKPLANEGVLNEEPSYEMRRRKGLSQKDSLKSSSRCPKSYKSNNSNSGWQRESSLTQHFLTIMIHVYLQDYPEQEVKDVIQFQCG
jgi:hypothetical protein